MPVRRPRRTAARRGCWAGTRRPSIRTSSPGPRWTFAASGSTTSDGDFWDFDWLAAPSPPTAPVVVLFHGLEGGADSLYARTLMAELAARGWRGVVTHFRGCAGTPNLLPRAYHSGDHEEVDGMLRAVRERVGAQRPLYAVGVSLGGSALLNWLGRRATRRVVAGARPPRCPCRSTSPPRESRSARGSTASTPRISCRR